MDLRDRSAGMGCVSGMMMERGILGGERAGRGTGRSAILGIGEMERAVAFVGVRFAPFAGERVGEEETGRRGMVR